MDTLEQALNKSFLWLERMQPATQIEIKNKLAIAEKQIIALAGKNPTAKQISDIINEAFSTFETVLSDDVENISTLTYNATQNIMASWTTIEAIKLNDATKATRKSLLTSSKLIQGHTMSNHLKHVERNTVRKIQGQIARGFDEGQGIQEIARNIRNTFGVVERNQLGTLTRTTLLESIRDSQDETMKYFEDEITAYYYNAVLDTRTTARCWSLNGKTSKNKEDIIKLLNFHYNCRSILGVRTALSDEFDAKQNVVQWDGKTVNHRDGTKSTKFKVDEVKKVSSKASPETAFRALDTEFQRQYMGDTRYKLWKDGKASFADMTSKTRNTFIPIDQLRKNLSL